MSVAIRAEADGERTRLVPAGTFDLAHAGAVVRAVEQAERDLIASGDVDFHLFALERIDGSGAVLLARLMNRLEARGLRTRLIDDQNHHAFRLIALYRERPAGAQPQPTRTIEPARSARVRGRCDAKQGDRRAGLPRSGRRSGSAGLRVPSLGRLVIVATADAGDLRGRLAGHVRREPAHRAHRRIPRRLAARTVRGGGVRSRAGRHRTISRARATGHRPRRGGPLGRGPGVGAGHDAGVGRNRRAAVDGHQRGELAGRTARVLRSWPLCRC